MICRHLGVARTPEPEIEMSLAGDFFGQGGETTIGQDEKDHQSSTWMERQKKEFANAYAPWTEEDEHKLISLFEQGKSLSEIALSMERNRGGIISRLKKLGKIRGFY